MRIARYLVVGLMAAAPVAWAQYDEDRDFRSEREARDRDRYYRLDVPVEREMREIRSIAQRLDTEMEGLQADVRRESRRMDLDRMEGNAVRWVDVLTARVDAFEDAVEDNMSRPQRTTDEFERMLGAFLRVNEQLRWLRGAGLVGDEFRRVNSMVRDIASYYGGIPEADTNAYYRLRNTVDIDDTDVSLRIGQGLRIDVPSIDLDIF